MAQRWNPKTHLYEDYDLPKGSILVSYNMNEIVSCARCGRHLKYGDTYTSRQIHNSSGLGYGVCRSCHKKEWEEESI